MIWHVKGKIYVFSNPNQFKNEFFLQISPILLSDFFVEFRTTYNNYILTYNSWRKSQKFRKWNSKFYLVEMWNEVAESMIKKFDMRCGCGPSMIEMRLRLR